MNIVEMRDFCFAYPDCSSKVLDQVNLSIQEGTLNVICGRSGCGKSTLLRHLKSVLMPHGTASEKSCTKEKDSEKSIIGRRVRKSALLCRIRTTRL